MTTYLAQTGCYLKADQEDNQEALSGNLDRLAIAIPRGPPPPLF